MDCYLCGENLGINKTGLCEACKQARAKRPFVTQSMARATTRTSILPSRHVASLVIAIMAVLYLCYLYGVDFSLSSRRHPPGMLVPGEPIQTTVSSQAAWKEKGYTVVPLARFKIKALVLLTARYYFASGSDIVPLDLTLSWGKLSDQRIIDKISFSHWHRHYSWWANELPLDPTDINSHVANMHMAPANRNVKQKLFSMNQGDVVYLEGYLIRLERGDGFTWQSSLTREDSGDGACELVWVDKAETISH